MTDKTAAPQQKPADADSSLWNSDLAPTSSDDHMWDWRAIASLWVGMVVCVPTYLLAGSLVSEGMAWWQAIITVFLGNCIVLIPMMLLGHAGTKHGIPFPVLLRASFGTVGAKIPALARGLVACGWFGINTWVGGSAIYVIFNNLLGGALTAEPLPLLDINIFQTICFLLFWVMHLWFIRNGTESIRWLETLAAPFLILMGLLLLGWAYFTAGGFGEMLSSPSQFVEGGPKAGQFWHIFFPSLTAMVGFWATMALNIPDFTRFAKTQKDQFIGQALGLPLPMAFFAFIGVAVTSATVTIFGEAIWDPVQLAGRMGGISTVVALCGLVVATLTTNLAANVVAPAYGFSNLSPSKISLKTGGYITAGIGIAIFPWKLLETAGGYLFTWLIGYSALLGPIAGIMLADYLFVRRTELEVNELYKHDGAYKTGIKGWNIDGLLALIIGIAPNIPGFAHAAGFIDSVPEIFDIIYVYAWFVGLFLGGASYLILRCFGACDDACSASNKE